MSQAMWASQVQVLQDSYRLVTYDVRGHGLSDVGDGQYMLEFFVEDLIGLLDALKIERAVLCGISMGGYIALRAIERYPGRVRGLVLCDTRCEADSNEAKLKRAAAIKTVKEKGVPAYAEGFLKNAFAAESFQARPQAVELARRIIASTSPLGICGALLALASRTDTTSALAAIGVPTLVLVGEKDVITPLSAAQTLQQGIAHAELHIVPGAGHLSNLENPDFFNDRLRSFLKERVKA
jgi:3-oxoadipate enol-lactonase